MMTKAFKEEVANSATHGLGVLLSIAALVVLVTTADAQKDIWKVVSFSIYGSSSITLYLSSTLYHLYSSPGLKRLLQLADHSAIFLFIAGTYTPFTLINLRGPWGWSLFGLIWAIAVTGIVLTFVYLGRFRLLFTILYLAMGWLVIIAFKPLLAAVPMGGILWIIGGGLFYSTGVFFYLNRNIPYGHAVWHLFVLAGSICHFLGIFFYVLPHPYF